MMKHHLFITSLILCLGLNAVATDKPTQELIQKNLGKVENSIKLTKEKIRHVSEVQFMPELYLSLGELLIDKSRLRYQLKMEQSVGKAPSDIDFTAEKQIKLEAIEVFTSIENRFPNFASLDRVLFAIGHEYREMGEDDQALKTYARLINSFPKSPLVVESDYLIGGIYYDKKDYEFSLKQYGKILSGKASPAMQMMADYKSGLCYVQLDKPLPALQSFERVATSSADLDVNDLPEDFRRKDVREEALVDSVKPFSDLSPEDLHKFPKYGKPLAYYRELAPNRPAYRSVLARLAKRLAFKTRYPDSAQAWYALYEIASDLTQSKESMESYYLAMKRAKRSDYPEHISGLIAQTLWSLKNEGQEKELSRYEPVLRDIATTLQKTAGGTKRSEDYKLAVDAYKDYLWIYPTGVHHDEMFLNLAESEFQMGSYVEAGRKFRALVDGARTADKKHDLYISSFDALERAFKDRDKLGLLEKAQGRAAYIDLAGRFGRTYPRDQRLPSINYDLAKLLYDDQDYGAAAKRLATFVRAYPHDTNASAAAVLLLDCYYIRDDVKGMSAQAKNLMALPLQASIKSQVQDILQKSQLKHIRSIAGNFATKSYASQFLKFAKDAGPSTLGETALMEAFVSLKASQDPGSFKVGEQYIGQYGEGAKAKDVFNNLIQMALDGGDYARAAKYLAGYSQKYKNDPDSKKFATAAAHLYENLGQTDEAAQFYSAINDPSSAADVYYKAHRWEPLVSMAARVPGAKGLFYQGLASYRLGKKDVAYQLFERVLSSGGQGDEKEFVAHAGYLLALKTYGDYLASNASGVSAIGSIKEKASALGAVDQILMKTIDQGAGDWTVASLHLQSVLYRDFARFLKAGPPPKPLSEQQYIGMITPQIKSYTDNAKSSLQKCVQSSEQFEIVSDFVESCRAGKMALVDEAQSGNSRAVASIPKNHADIRSVLLKNPHDTGLLRKLAQNAASSGDYAQARLLYGRVLEIKPGDAGTLADLGVLSLFELSWSDALLSFKDALKKDSSNRTALWGLAGLYRKFGYQTKLLPVLKQARAAGQPTTLIHPLMRF